MATDATNPPVPPGQSKSIYQIAREDGRYSPEAFEFVQEGLNFTLSRLAEHRHVTGTELSEGLRDLALQRYGLLARTVLAGWNISATLDFGNIVYAMVKAGVMSKRQEDRLEDFQDVYDFEEAFDREFAIELKD
jgi:uncharacterized repeat protein (TIGR04138 family)